MLDVNVSKLWKDHGIDSIEIRNAFLNTPIKEIRMLINNICNTNCSHCFYGFKDMIREPLTKEEWLGVIDKAVDLGVISFHFSGKEPFINDDIFFYTDYIKRNYPFVIFDVITNGINIPKYIKEIKNAGFQRVMLSYGGEDFTIRKYEQEKFFNALTSLLENDILTHIYISAAPTNYRNIKDYIRYFNSLGVENFFIAPVKYCGDAKNNSHLLLNPEQINELLFTLGEEEYSENCRVDLSITGGMFEGVNNEDFYKLIAYCIETDDDYIGNNLYLNLDLMCCRYLWQATLTPDGYILGCATEVSYKDYYNYSAGNVRDLPLDVIFKRGKEMSIRDSIIASQCAKENGCYYCNGGCPGRRYCYSKIRQEDN